MIRAAFTTAAFAALVVALPAVAQDAETPIDQFARCSVAAHAARARALLALARVVPAVGNCAPQGAKLGFNRDQLHALVAEGMLKLRGETPAQ
ncbi:MAG: hypothetical protein J7500_10260 [Sphingomonas sp.]|uniref:hypothetical protein n=1 Tax=Sphingomonas sp. TaxID=28214 RepID=UPI001B23BDD2|nr:hypothetical protein [Sphingomonas sp.]MBO9623081.1 hypothetical protein [Sphingomonas sp.]